MTEKLLTGTLSLNTTNHFTAFSEFERPRDKTNKVSVRPAKTQMSLGIHPVLSESSLSAWRKLGSLATHWAQRSLWSDWMPRLIWVFAGRIATLLVLSWGGSFFKQIHSWTRIWNLLDIWGGIIRYVLWYEPHHKKTCLWGLRPDKTQTSLLRYKSQLVLNLSI